MVTSVSFAFAQDMFFMVRKKRPKTGQDHNSTETEQSPTYKQFHRKLASGSPSDMFFLFLMSCNCVVLSSFSHKKFTDLDPSPKLSSTATMTETYL